jgi:hypothetical protein
MLSGQDSFSISGVNFRYRNLDHGNWLQPAPPEARKPSPARLIADTFHLAQ